MSNHLKKVQIVVYGLGPIGLEILKKCEKTFQSKVVGAIDIDAEKIGKDIGILTGEKEKGIIVVPSIKEVKTEKNDPRIALHATGSNLRSVWPQIKELLDNGFSVVSTCEQLSYPWHRYPELSKEIHEYAIKKGLKIIGTGVNPGYIMDTLVLSFTSVINTISSIKVERRVNVTKRRLPLQKKVGVGLQVEEFNRLAKEGKIGHVGLEESLRLIAAGLNLELKHVENKLIPTISEESYILPEFSIKKGDVNGQHQVSKGTTIDGKIIELVLTMSTSVKSEDRIVIEGDMRQELVIPNGIFGDSATASIIINTAKTLALESKSGLLTMKDIMLTRNVQI